MTQTVKQRPPFIRTRSTSAGIFWGTSAALFPIVAAAFYSYQTYALRLILVTVISGLAAETLGRLLLGRKPQLGDGSTFLASLVLALLMPPALPLWMAASASVFGVLAAKEFYGGYAQHPFNPAAAGLAFLAVGFPITMNQFIEPLTFEEVIPPILNAKRAAGSGIDWSGLLLGPNEGWLGAASPAAILLGGLFLMSRRLVIPEVPLIFLGGLAAACALLGLPVEIHVFTGSALLAAFFLAADPVTTPHSRTGARAFALFCGALLAVLRKFSVYSDGTAVVILLANALTPWLDEFFRPRRAHALKAGNEE